MKILFAEDTKDLSRAVCAVLSHEGYDVDPVYDGEEALSRLQSDSYDVIVLDIMMPKMDGLEVLSAARSQGLVTPILLLTAKAEVDDRVAGLDGGADDYLTKPFAMKELLARLRALTRRKLEYDTTDLSFEGIRLTGESLELICENTVRLSIKEYELMHLLMRSAPRSLSSAYLLEHVWPSSPDAGEETLWLYISYLRNKLRSIASRVTIKGEKGGSYLLCPIEDRL